MHLRIPVKTAQFGQPSHFSPLPHHQQKVLFFCSVKNSSANSFESDPLPSSSSSSAADKKFGFKLVGRPLGDSKWKLKDIDANKVQESVNQWLSKTQNFLNEVTSPLVKNVHDRRPYVRNDSEDMEDIFIAEHTVNSRTPGGDLSGAAIVSIEQFSRMNGLTGGKMQNTFRALVSESVYNNPRNLVEYCCFRFLLRNNADVHPGLKEPAFRRLIFVTRDGPVIHEA